MNTDNQWMMMTYYCPTHGDSGRIEPFEIASKDISQTPLKKDSRKDANE